MREIPPGIKEFGRGAAAAIGVSVSLGALGATGGYLGHEVAAQIAVAHDQKEIDACGPLIAKLPTKALSMDCRNVKVAMEASQQDLINSMHNLRDAYLTPARREAEAADIRIGIIGGGAVLFAGGVIGGTIAFIHNRKDRRWCAEYKKQVSSSALYNEQRKMTAL